MIRLTLILCAGLFGAMIVAGEDHGQQRFGLMPRDPSRTVLTQATVPQQPVRVATNAPASASKPAHVLNAAFVPAEPLMKPNQPVETPVAVVDATAPAGRVLRVNTRAMNVRAGPGTDYSVVGQLVRGEEVLVVVEDEGPDGWTMIRIEGDGVEGYAATRLLTE